MPPNSSLSHDGIVKTADKRWHAHLRLFPLIVIDRNSSRDINIYDTLPDPNSFACAIRETCDLPGLVSIIVSGALLRYYDLVTMTKPDLNDLRDRLAECGLRSEQISIDHLPERCAFRIGDSSIVTRFVPIVFMEKSGTRTDFSRKPAITSSAIQHNLFLQYWQPGASVSITTATHAMQVAKAIAKSEQDTMSAISSTVKYELSAIHRRVKRVTLDQQHGANNHEHTIYRVEWENADTNDGTQEGDISIPLPFRAHTFGKYQERRFS